MVESTIGEIVTNKNLYEKTKNAKLGPQFWKILSRVAIVVAIVVGTIQIGESVVTLLPNNLEETQESEIIETTQASNNDANAIKL